jgi:hypothetical protein
MGAGGGAMTIDSLAAKATARGVPEVIQVTLSFLTLERSWFAYIRSSGRVFAGAGSSLDLAVRDALALAFPEQARALLALLDAAEGGSAE